MSNQLPFRAAKNSPDFFPALMSIGRRWALGLGGGWALWRLFRSRRRAALPLAGRSVLISAGPTFEPIDPVRFLGNRSSGKMGFALAAEAAQRGARTLLVAGPVALETPAGVERIDVQTALEMQRAIHDRLDGLDVVVMTAAVGDFRPRQVAASKLKKSRGIPTLELERNPDILAGLAEAAPWVLRVGFAAETDPDAVEARAKLARKGCHLLVLNDVSRREIGFGSDHNEVTVYSHRSGPKFFSRRPKDSLALDLWDTFESELVARARNPSSSSEPRGESFEGLGASAVS